MQPPTASQKKGKRPSFQYARPARPGTTPRVPPHGPTRLGEQDAARVARRILTARGATLRTEFKRIPDAHDASTFVTLDSIPHRTQK
ncbi:hypothetical protein [Burkholderia pseudomallei]|uniref:hypothetical protein n=1 Tax=Burkholderia pseudomallei TaxID=28450 RepID=UPI0021553918|nr:hypothetical protein [Burkholderia pseudomallei]